MNSVDYTKLPCYTPPLTQHHSFFKNLPPLYLKSIVQSQDIEFYDKCDISSSVRLLEVSLHKKICVKQIQICTDF